MANYNYKAFGQPPAPKFKVPTGTQNQHPAEKKQRKNNNLSLSDFQHLSGHEGFHAISTNRNISQDYTWGASHGLLQQSGLRPSQNFAALYGHVDTKFTGEDAPGSPNLATSAQFHAVDGCFSQHLGPAASRQTNERKRSWDPHFEDDDSEMADRTSKKVPYRCKLCDPVRYYDHIRQFAMHQHSAHNIDVYSCICGKGFTRTDNLHAHIKSVCPHYNPELRKAKGNTNETKPIHVHQQITEDLIPQTYPNKHDGTETFQANVEFGSTCYEEFGYT